MKFAENTVTVEGNAVFEVTKKMAVENESISRIIRSLTDMYSEPLLAIAREYISNAYDATISRMGIKSSFGTVLDIPIEVTLPSSLSPTFTVRDYGIGMDRDVLLNVFPQYGASTKRENNNEIGGFGLGAKSALAVVSNFTVTTVKDGLKNVAIIQKGADGVGEVSLLPEQITDESSGTVVTISFSSSKAVELQQIFSQPHLLIGFPNGSIKVNGKMHEDSLYNPEKYIKISDAGWLSKSIFSKTYHATPAANFGWNNRGAVVGPISYAISSRAVNEAGWDSYLMQNTVLNLPIGSVDFTPARENLIFSDLTNEAIVETQNRLMEEVQQYLLDYVSKSESQKEAVERVQELRNHRITARNGRELKFEFNGEQIPELKLDNLLFGSHYANVPVTTDEADYEFWFSNPSINRGKIVPADASQYMGGFRISRSVVVTEVSNNKEELLTLNTYRKLFNSFHYKKEDWRNDEISVIYTTKKASELSKWLKYASLDVLSAEEWAKQGEVYAEKVKEEKRAAARARRAQAGTTRSRAMADPYFTVLGENHRSEERPQNASYLASDIRASNTVIYIQLNHDKADTISHEFASALSNKPLSLTICDLNYFLAAAKEHYKAKDKNVSVVRVSASMKIENFLKYVPHAISADEALVAIAAGANAKIEDDMERLTMNLRATRRGGDASEWVGHLSSTDVAGIENEDVRKFYELVKSIPTRSAFGGSKMFSLAKASRLQTAFGDYRKNIMEAFLYPAPLLSNVRPYSFDTKAAVEYINLLYPAGK